MIILHINSILILFLFYSCMYNHYYLFLFFYFSSLALLFDSCNLSITLISSIIFFLCLYQWFKAFLVKKKNIIWRRENLWKFHHNGIFSMQKTATVSVSFKMLHSYVDYHLFVGFPPATNYGVPSPLSSLLFHPCSCSFLLHW